MVTQGEDHLGYLTVLEGCSSPLSLHNNTHLVVVRLWILSGVSSKRHLKGFKRSYEFSIDVTSHRSLYSSVSEGSRLLSYPTTLN